MILKEQQFRESIGLPKPEGTPQEIMRDLMAFRNEWKLYRRKCDFTGAEIISAYHPDKPFKVFRNDIWWSDKWDAADYGRDFDFTRPFFEQFAELQQGVPREGTSIFNSENCDYNSHIRESRNCYLNSLVAKCEDCQYCYWIVGDKDVHDSMYTNNSTRCYECINTEKCYECVMLQEAKDCSDCHFSFQLQNCKNCIFSSNVAGKEYFAFNKQVTQDEFLDLKRKYLSGSYADFQEGVKKFHELKSSTVHRATHNINCENCIGDHVLSSRNVELAFDGNDGEDIYNVISFDHSKDIYHAYSAGWPECEQIYRSLVSRGSKDIAFSYYSWFSSGLRYCDSTNTSHDCFGCVGMRQKRYCILNKQYTKEEYEALVPRIVEHMKKTGEWGKFFPKNLSPFAYNETPAMDFFPLSKKEATDLGYAWLDYEAPIPKVEKVIPADKLPNLNSEIPDDVLNWALKCVETQKPFKLNANELKFYREMGIPVPRVHPEIRHAKRMHLHNPRELYDRSCAKCGTSTKASYAPDRKETVYCEACFLKEVY